MITKKIHILAVEDEPINQMMLKFFLKEAHLEAEIVGTGQQALAAIHHQTFDLIFMDLGLPDLNGIEVSKQIRQMEAAQGLNPAFICALTAEDSAEKKQVCLAAGMNDYLNKPITLSQLQYILQKIST